MKRLFLLLSLLALTLIPIALAFAGDGYNLDWWTADSGGGTSSGEDYALSGTAGQPDAGVMAGGDYTLVGGFWGGEQATQLPLYEVILTLILKNWSPGP